MKRLLAAAILSVVTLGGTTPTASAWCLDHLFHHCHHCCVKVHCKQYNAFSPPCCDCMPQGNWGMNGACGPMGCGASFGGDCNGGVNELPAPGSLLTPPGNPMPKEVAPPTTAPTKPTTSNFFPYPQQNTLGSVQSMGYWPGPNPGFAAPMMTNLAPNAFSPSTGR